MIGCPDYPGGGDCEVPPEALRQSGQAGVRKQTAGVPVALAGAKGPTVTQKKAQQHWIQRWALKWWRSSSSSGSNGVANKR